MKRRLKIEERQKKVDLGGERTEKVVESEGREA